MTMPWWLRRALCEVGLLTWPCPHKWRPASINGYPSRVCDLCDRDESLEPGEFYAQFNRIPPVRRDP